MKRELTEFNKILNRLSIKQENLYNKYAAHFGISSTSFWILYTVCETEAEIYTQNMLAEMWNIPKQSLNSAVRVLVKQGYIKLEKIGSARNSKALKLTPEGEELCRRAIYPFYELEERLLGRISKEEREKFLQLSIKQLSLMEEEIEAVINRSDTRE